MNEVKVAWDAEAVAVHCACAGDAEGAAAAQTAAAKAWMAAAAAEEFPGRAYWCKRKAEIATKSAALWAARAQEEQ